MTRETKRAPERSLFYIIYTVVVITTSVIYIVIIVIKYKKNLILILLSLLLLVLLRLQYCTDDSFPIPVFFFLYPKMATVTDINLNAA